MSWESFCREQSENCRAIEMGLKHRNRFLFRFRLIHSQNCSGHSRKRKVPFSFEPAAAKATERTFMPVGLYSPLRPDDAVRGFAFVDLCHKVFDVALMNPPFGDP